jgi:hypothetical protein
MGLGLAMDVAFWRVGCQLLQPQGIGFTIEGMATRAQVNFSDVRRVIEWLHDSGGGVTYDIGRGVVRGQRNTPVFRITPRGRWFLWVAMLQERSRPQEIESIL